MSASEEDFDGGAGVESVIIPIVIVAIIGLLMYKSVLVVRGKCRPHRVGQRSIKESIFASIRAGARKISRITFPPTGPRLAAFSSFRGMLFMQCRAVFAGMF